MLVTLNEVMKIAEEKGIAIGSFNTPNLESLQAIIEAAEELSLPVIIQFAQCHEPWIPLTLIGPIMVDVAEKATVPVCVHLDHGETLEYLETALEIGFTGIMYDGSVLSYEEKKIKHKLHATASPLPKICLQASFAEDAGARQNGTYRGGPMNELGFPRQTLDPSCNLTGLVLNSKIPLSHSFIYSRVPHPRAHGLVPPVK